MKDHVETSLKDRSTSVSEGGKTGIGVVKLAISKILFDLRTRRWRCGSLVSEAMLEKDGRRLSSRVRSVIVGFRICSPSAV